MDVTREDLSLFLNACAVATSQREFYTGGTEQRVSLRFLHQYICGNYRTLYARTLAAGINHHNQTEVVFQLLSTGKSCPADFREEEGLLIRAALQKLPPQRAWKLFARLKEERVNNRRTRKAIETYLQNRPELAFDAVKYRHKVKGAHRHAHIRPTGEVPVFLFEGLKKPFETPLLEHFRQAHYSKEAIYQLPYSIAEGFAAKHGVPRAEFLRRIEGKMTDRERLRMQEASGGKLTLRPEKLSLMELCAYVLGLSLSERREKADELREHLQRAVRSTLRHSGGLPLPGGKVAAVLDNSYSASGSAEKKNRPLAVALSVHLLLEGFCQTYRAFWTHPTSDALLVHARGQTHLSDRLLDALEWGADTVVIVSDGCDNDLPGAFPDLLQTYRNMGGKARILHLNPVFDPEHYQVRSLAPDLPALGLRAGEDLATTLAFARFSNGDTPLEHLEAHLKARAEHLIHALRKDPDENR